MGFPNCSYLADTSCFVSYVYQLSECLGVERTAQLITTKLFGVIALAVSVSAELIASKNALKDASTHGNFVSHSFSESLWFSMPPLPKSV